MFGFCRLPGIAGYLRSKYPGYVMGTCNLCNLNVGTATRVMFVFVRAGTSSERCKIIVRETHPGLSWHGTELVRKRVACDGGKLGSLHCVVV